MNDPVGVAVSMTIKIRRLEADLDSAKRTRDGAYRAAILNGHGASEIARELRAQLIRAGEQPDDWRNAGIGRDSISRAAKTLDI